MRLTLLEDLGRIVPALAIFGVGCGSGVAIHGCNSGKALSDNRAEVNPTFADKSEHVEGGKGNQSTTGGDIINIGNAPLAGCTILFLLALWLWRGGRLRELGLRRIAEYIENRRGRTLDKPDCSVASLVEALRAHQLNDPVARVIDKAVQAATGAKK